MKYRCKAHKCIAVKVLIILSIAGAIYICGCGNKVPDWPKSVWGGIWIPNKAKVYKYNFFKKSTYEVLYKVKASFPGESYISSMVEAMSKNGWKRLEYDFLNPKIKSHFARGDGGEWGNFSVGEGEMVYQWMENWEDANRNIVVYRLRYYLKKGDDVRKEKELDVYVVYMPEAVRENLLENTSAPK